MNIPALICDAVTTNPIEQNICQNILRNPCPFLFEGKSVKECEELQKDFAKGKILKDLIEAPKRVESSFRTITTLCAFILIILIVVLLVLLFHVMKK